MAFYNDDYLTQDIEDIGQIPIIPELLNTIFHTTGMGFVAIARVTEDKWVTCITADKIGFGLRPGDELELETTLCNDVRQLTSPIIIDHVAVDKKFREHHTPIMYGFQSYISIPIIRKNGSFFGTLCALDKKPNQLNSPHITGMFKMFADLISFHLDSIEKSRQREVEIVQERNYFKKHTKKQRNFSNKLEKIIEHRTAELLNKNKKLERINDELQSYAHASSHDLQEPLRKIQVFISRLENEQEESLSETANGYFNKIKLAASRMQILINDLVAYSQSENHSQQLENVDLKELLDEVFEDLHADINENVTILSSCNLNVIRFQFKQIFSNLLGNSIKFAHPEKPLEITINCNRIEMDSRQFSEIIVSDNGIGFDEKYKDKIFKLFQRLHDKALYAGTGMGLAIVKKIIDNHNGYIEVHSRVNSGTKFRILVPYDN